MCCNRLRNLGGNSEYFEIPDKTLNKLETKKTLDRENPPLIPYVVVYTTNDCTNKPVVGSCLEIDATKGQYLNVTVNVSKIMSTISFILSASIVLVGLTDFGCERL